MNFSMPEELYRPCADSPEPEASIQPIPTCPNPIPVPPIIIATTTITTTTTTTTGNVDIANTDEDLICLDSPPLPPLPSLPPSSSSPDLISFSPRPNPTITINLPELPVPLITISDADSTSNYDPNAENFNPNIVAHIPGNSDVDDSNLDSYSSDSFLMESNEDGASGLFEDDDSRGNRNINEQDDGYEGEDDDGDYDDGEDDSENRGRSPTQRPVLHLEPGSPEFLRDRDNFATQGGSGFTPATGDSITGTQRQRNRRANLEELAKWNLDNRRLRRNTRNDEISPLASRNHVDYDVLERFEEMEIAKESMGATTVNLVDRREFGSAGYIYSRQPVQAHWPPVFCLDKANLKRFEKRTSPPKEKTEEKAETIKEEEEKTEKKPDKGKGKMVAKAEDDPFM